MKKISILLLFIISIFLLQGEVSFAATPSINTIYTSYTSQTPVNTTFGNATRVDYGVASNKDLLSFESWWGLQKDYSSYGDIYYVVYKYSKPLNARIKKLKNETIFISAGGTFSHTRTITAGTSYTYETMVEYELGMSYSYSTDLTVGGLNYM